jgi:hypothetical protein
VTVLQLPVVDRAMGYAPSETEIAAPVAVD